MNNKYKILLVEDDQNIRTFVSSMLEAEGYYVIIAKSCSEAHTMFNSYNPNLTILDLGLPDKDGIEFLKDIRNESNMPVIVLSARDNESDKVNALDLGANDYVTKPFGSKELLARIRTALRSNNYSYDSSLFTGNKFVLRDLVIDHDSRRVYINNVEIKLTQTEYNILTLLAKHCGKMLTYSSIIKEIWGYSDEGSIKKLQVNMANIRKKFGVKPGDSKYIINELGVGYRMNLEN